MSRKLTYFEFNGLGEAIRYILHYGGLEFEDVRVAIQDWPDKELIASLPCGQLPLYEEDGRTLNQSFAIARYLARQVGLLPEDAWEQAKLDAAVLNMYDFIHKLRDYYWQPDPTQREINKKILEEAKPFFLSRFEKDLKAGNGHFNGKWSWADFELVATIEGSNTYLEDTVNKDYPAITALMEKVHALPGVKQYLATRKPYSKPVLRK